MDLGVFCCLESSVFRLCSLVLFEEVPRLTWLICSALNEKGGKGSVCLLEILWLRQLSLAAFTHWSLSKLQFNAACKLECSWLSLQHRQDRQEILEQSVATCCIWGDGGPKKEQRTPFSKACESKWRHLHTTPVLSLTNLWWAVQDEERAVVCGLLLLNLTEVNVNVLISCGNNLQPGS